jgi:hypothetical protein
MGGIHVDKQAEWRPLCSSRPQPLDEIGKQAIRCPAFVRVVEKHIWIFAEFLVASINFALRKEVIMPHFKEISNPNRVHRLKRIVV